MSDEQIEEARSMIGTMPRSEIAQELGVSESNLKRGLRGTSIWFHNGKYKNRPELVKQVMDYYYKHGKPATVKQFPSVNVKCIIERPEYYGIKKKFRQRRWTDQELIELTKMAGIISETGQAKYFKRPGANEGSIKSVWMKRFHLGSGFIHGMSEYMAKHLVNKKTPYVQTAFWQSRRDGVTFGRKLYLWVDMENNLQPEIPEFIRDAIVQMAKFQRWLFDSENPKSQILKLIKAREVKL